MSEVKPVQLLCCPCCGKMMDWLWSISVDHNKGARERFKCNFCDLVMVLDHKFNDFEDRVRQQIGDVKHEETM